MGALQAKAGQQEASQLSTEQCSLSPGRAGKGRKSLAGPGREGGISTRQQRQGRWAGSQAAACQQSLITGAGVGRCTRVWGWVSVGRSRCPHGSAASLRSLLAAGALRTSGGKCVHPSQLLSVCATYRCSWRCVHLADSHKQHSILVGLSTAAPAVPSRRTCSPQSQLSPQEQPFLHFSHLHWAAQEQLVPHSHLQRRRRLGAEPRGSPYRSSIAFPQAPLGAQSQHKQALTCPCRCRGTPSCPVSAVRPARGWGEGHPVVTRLTRLSCPSPGKL